MSRGRSLSRRTPAASRLSPEEVFLVMSVHATTRPLPTVKVTDLCEAAYADRCEVTNHVVYERLLFLQRRGRVVSYSGEGDTEELVRLGLPRPDSAEERHARYWMLTPDQR